MGVTEQRMEQLGITLQQTDWRGKGAVEAVLAGDMLYISAHYPVDENGTPVYVGRVGAEIDEAAAYQAARLCGLNMLRTIQAYIGSLDRVDYFVKALGLVNSAGDFYNMPAVMNGYSDLMVEIFGHRGQHRGVDPTPIRDCQITAFNGPCRIGAAICLPGDIVIGTKNGILFVPSHMVDYVIEHAYKSQVRDLYAFPKLEAGIYTTADVDAVVWNDQMMQALLNFIDTDPAAAKYRGLDWSVELRAAAGDEAAIDELYQQFDIERYGAPGQKKEVLI